MAQFGQSPSVGHMSVVYTNPQSVVIYVDSNFSNLFKFASGGSPIGKPFQNVLGIEEGVGQSLIDEIKRSGTLAPRLLTVRMATGAEMEITCTARAARDDKGNFLGMNLELYESGIEVAVAQQHPDDAELLFLYFTRRLIAIIVLVARVIGEKLRDKMEDTINQAARNNGWAIVITSGQIDIGGQLDVDAYQSLLKTAEEYAAGIIGRRIVDHETLQLDQSLDMVVTRAASKYGLRG